jgi:soluble lytic murein transglycosylase-like protein
MRQESDCKHHAVSPVGAAGLMQIHYANLIRKEYPHAYPRRPGTKGMTESQKREFYKNHPELFEPKANITEGVRRLRYAIKVAENKRSYYGQDIPKNVRDTALAIYNMGEAGYNGSTFLPAETREYLKRVDYFMTHP